MFLQLDGRGFSPSTRYRYIQREFIAATLGAFSYLGGPASLEYGRKKCHVLVGRYSSLAHRLCFLIGLNHNHHEVTTYPFLDIEQMGNDADTMNHYFESNHYQVIVGNDVWIGADVILLGGARIGDGAVIGAGAVISGYVPPYAVAVGNPVRIVKFRFDDATIRKLLMIQWWNWGEEKIKKAYPLMKNVHAFVDTYYHEEESMESEVACALHELRQQGYRVYYFIPETAISSVVWQDVFRQYVQCFSAGDKVVLMLEVRDIGALRIPLQGIMDQLDAMGDNAPLVMTHQGNQMPSPDILRNIDVFITTREEISSCVLSYETLYRFSVVSGLDEGIFLQERCIIYR